MAKEYRNRMYQDPFKFYLGDYLIPENEDSIDDIIQVTAYFRSSGDIRVKAILDHDQEHGLYSIGIGVRRLSGGKSEIILTVFESWRCLL